MKIINPLPLMLTILIGLLAAACSQKMPSIMETSSYVAVDTKNYESPEAAQQAMALARQQCATPRQPTDYQTGRNAVSAVMASNEEMSAAAFDACMANKGFLRKN